jgi:hypothetical protein
VRLTFGSANLLLEDPDGRAARFLESYLPVQQLVTRLTPTWRTDRRDLPHCTGRGFVGLPTPNWPAPPTPRLNTLYWPTGATRWAFGLFLIDGKQWDALRTDIVGEEGTLNSSQTLSIREQDGEVIEGPMYALPPWQVGPTVMRSAADDGQDDRLFILPLVDQRYWWQFVAVPEFEPSDWDAAFDQLGSALEIDNFAWEAVEEAYGRPALRELHRPWENAAMLLDAVAATVGQRIVRQVNGDTYAENPTVAAEELHPQLDSLTKRLGLWTAGGRRWQDLLSGHLPQSVRVVFPSGSGFESISVTALSLEEEIREVLGDDFVDEEGEPLPIGFTSPYRKVFRTLAEWVEPDPDPENPGFCQDLADIVAKHFMQWAALGYHFAFGGINQWTLTGFDDSVIWSLGERVGDRWSALTTVRSLAVHLGTDELPLEETAETLSDPDCGCGGGEQTVTRVLGQITEWYPDHLHGDAALVTVTWKNAPGTIPDSSPGNGIVVYDLTGKVFQDSAGSLVGRWCWADFMMPANQTEACSPETGIVGETGPTSLCRWVTSGITCAEPE